jgi:hypothetical protein
MTQDSTHEDHIDTIISVTLSTGETIQEVNCSCLRIFYGNDSCDAQALISYYYINSLTTDGIRIDPKSYILFQDADGYEWKILDFKDNPVTDAPGLIFRLSASS